MRSRIWLIVGVVAIVFVTSGLAYAAGTSHSTTKTIVKTAAPPPTATPASPTNCVQGVAPGSCNTDEAKEVGIPDRPLTPARARCSRRNSLPRMPPR